MSKLELKHLAPYLPYGLQVLTGDGIGKITGVPDMLTGGDVIKVHFGANLKRKKFDFGFGGSEYNKPTNFGYYYINRIILQNVLDKNDVLDFSDSLAIPILHPLSDLVKPCLPEGKIPIVELAKIAYKNIFSHCPTFKKTEFFKEHESHGFIGYSDGNRISLTHDVDVLQNAFDFYVDGSRLFINQLALFKWLYEHHFDVHNLIGQNLAIDINTLQK